MMNNIDFNKIIEAVKSTRAIVLDDDLRNQISVKGEADFVTEVDYQISRYLEKELSVLTPDIGFMSEEEDTEIVPTRWILDPIDGTTNLIYGYNVVCRRGHRVRRRIQSVQRRRFYGLSRQGRLL